VSASGWLAERFEEQRPRLRAIAYRILGSASEADDTVQNAWLRLSGADAEAIDSLEAWLTTVVARLALNALRARRQHPVSALESRVQEPVADPADGSDPEQQALLSDSVGLAMLVVLQTLTPAERIAFVLHDMFAVPFEDIAAVIDRSPAAARQLASRARRRVRGQAPGSDRDVAARWQAADAFLAAARNGDFEALLAVLDPEVVLRADRGGAAGLRLARGARAVARQAASWGRVEQTNRRALVDGRPAIVSYTGAQILSVGTFRVRGHRIVEIEILADPQRLATLEITLLE
jgi:RNA polymerase sigma factor (sigma-70 family)